MLQARIERDQEIHHALLVARECGEQGGELLAAGFLA